MTQLHYYAIDANPPVANRWYGRLASITTGSIQSQSITSYDLVGNVTGLSSADHTGEAIAASDNELDQLVGFGGIETYAYIPGGQRSDIGNLQTKGSAAYTYATTGAFPRHAPTSILTIGAHGYDQNGN